MSALHQGSLKTRTFSSLGLGDLLEHPVCIYAGAGPDERSALSVWKERAAHFPEKCIAVVRENADEIVVCRSGAEWSVALRDEEGLSALFRNTSGAYVDISGLSHHVWAPVVRSALGVCSNVWAIYAEPLGYRVHPSPSSFTVFDLSDGFSGLSPLPGFARLGGPEDETQAVFVPFLGFEGMRVKSLAMSLDPIPKTIPVVGLPGYRVEFPAHAVASNRDFLEEQRALGEIRLARASCPFEAYDTLAEIQRDFPGRYMYIAPIGTKPQALGAVLYALGHSGSSELMYDHPKRKQNRSRGVGRVHVYSIK
ncbi:hypothetical protein [Corallococcus silvisoli]|uniref:hypothetical protein n=1 Tax=Corallococcus silvisoli TaxID=2697031 RepID=UPI0013767F7B|nr:hypothetical protein [Corallococcus silvisoli]NBD08025.1 hypothetical protein [Corallococcus silvisoli]